MKAFKVVIKQSLLFSLVSPAVWAASSDSAFADTIYINNLPSFMSYAHPGSMVTTVTGIRDNGITGNFLIPNSPSGATGGLFFPNGLVNPQPFPTATANHSNYPGATTNTPYGPTVGTPGGILRATGSYNYNNSGYQDIGYLYDGAPAAGQSQYTTIIGGNGVNPTLFTIGHSNFGNLLVGNFDTQLNEGQAFLYDIRTGGNYVINAFMGIDPTGRNALSSTAYGVYGNMIAGGAQFAAPFNGNQAYVARVALDANGSPITNAPGFQGTPQRSYTFLTAPAFGDGIVTHFEGITSGGRANTYNMVADSVNAAGETVSSWVVHYDAATGDSYWVKYSAGENDATARLTSANSIYQNKVIGVYVDKDGRTKAYSVEIPNAEFAANAIHMGGFGNPFSLLYDPVLISTPLRVVDPNSIGNATRGDDVINNSEVTVLGANSVGVYSSNYEYSRYGGGVDANFGTVRNNGTISAKGTGSAGIVSTGLFGTILNYGTLNASTGAYAIRNRHLDDSSTGLITVNYGVIDGVVDITNDRQARTENSGWMGISAPGSGAVHHLSGVFSQTANGVLSLRTDGASVDSVSVDGRAYLNGALSIYGNGRGISRLIGSSFSIVSATEGVDGKFSKATSNLSFLNPVLTYGGRDVTLGYSLTPFSVVGRTLNQRNVGNALTLGAYGPVSGPGANVLDTLFYGSYQSAQAVMDTVGGAGLAGVQATALQVGQMASSTISDQIAFWRSEDGDDALRGTLDDDDVGGRAGGRDFMAYAPTETGVSPKTSIRIDGSAAGFAPPLRQDRTYRAWGSMFGGGANFLTDPGRGAPASNVGYYGGLIGVDYQVAPNLLVGVALGGSSANYNVGSLSTNGGLTGFHAGLYGAYTMGASYIALNETFSSYSNQTSRSAGGFGLLPYESLSARFGSTEFRTRLEGGHTLSMGGLKATPFIAAEFAAYQSNAFTEQSSLFYQSSLMLRNNGQSINSVPAFAGLRLSNAYTLGNGWRLLPVGSVAYVHEFSPNRQLTNMLLSIPGPDFNVTGPRSTYNLVQAKIGTQLYLSRQFALFSDFQGEFSSVSQSYAGKGGMKYSW